MDPIETASLVFLSVGGTFGLVGLAFACVALGIGLKRRRRRMLCSATALGYIETVAIQPTIAFIADGLTYRKAFFGQPGRAYAVGQCLTVRYDPSDPGNGYVEGEDTPQRVLIGVFGGLGGAFLLVTGLLALVLL